MSNLGVWPRQVDYPDLPGLPDQSPVVSAGTHEIFTYTLDSGLAGDFDGDNDVDGDDFLFWQRDDATPAGLQEWQDNFPTLARISHKHCRERR